jgi:hypothetical protein
VVTIKALSKSCRHSSLKGSFIPNVMFGCAFLSSFFFY